MPVRLALARARPRDSAFNKRGTLTCSAIHTLVMPQCCHFGLRLIKIIAVDLLHVISVFFGDANAVLDH